MPSTEEAAHFIQLGHGHEHTAFAAASLAGCIGLSLIEVKPLATSGRADHFQLLGICQINNCYLDTINQPHS